MVNNGSPTNRANELPIQNRKLHFGRSTEPIYLARCLQNCHSAKPIYTTNLEWHEKNNTERQRGGQGRNEMYTMSSIAYKSRRSPFPSNIFSASAIDRAGTMPSSRQFIISLSKTEQGCQSGIILIRTIIVENCMNL